MTSNIFKTGLVFVQLSDNDIKGKVIEVSDITGKKQLIKENPDAIRTMDTSGLNNGMYFLTVRCNDLSTTEKIVLKR